jgi:hypothetical protein
VIALAAPMLGAGLLLGAELVSPDQPFGWLGAVLLAALGSFTLWRAGSVKAWKDTAEARYRRIGDLERELGQIHGELAIPERIEGIVRLMSDTAHQAGRRGRTGEPRPHWSELACGDRRTFNDRKPTT